MAELTYRYHVGDIVRLRHSNPLIPAGDYVLLQVDDVVAMARLIHSSRGHVIAKKRVYVQITDMCLFEETGRNIRPQSKRSATQAGNTTMGLHAMPTNP